MLNENESLNKNDVNIKSSSFVELNSKVVKDFSYSKLLRELSENTTPTNEETNLIEKEATVKLISETGTKRKMTRDEENAIIMRNILIWVPIGLSVIVIYAAYLVAYMSIPKSTILYASYVSNKGERLN